MTPSIPRSEYPRPDASRPDWHCLNGEWEFEFDPRDQGLKESWQSKPAFSKRIIVPFPFQSTLSGINSQEFIETVWYGRQISIPPEHQQKQILLHFGAVDYECIVFINGTFAFHHVGGVTPFTVNITNLLVEPVIGPQRIVLRVHDPQFSSEIPRGKQTTKTILDGCSYEKVTGAWQAVWLEFINSPVYLDRNDVSIRADPFTGRITAGIRISGADKGFYVVEAQAFDGTRLLGEGVFQAGFNSFAAGGRGFSAFQENHIETDPTRVIPWSPESPKLYRLVFRLIDGDSDEEDVIDELTCTFGYRTIEARGNKLYLNGKEIYLKMALYQGYWPDGLWTAPDDEKIKKDLQFTLDMGFNALRIHQKVEDPRFLHHADTMGVMLWGEMSNAFDGSPNAKQAFIHEWQDVIRRDRGHPSIIAWTPLNESWGTGDLSKVENQEWLRSVYHVTKSLDATRPVSENDGWEHVITDICSVHDYSLPPAFAARWPVSKPDNIIAYMASSAPGNRTWAPGCISRDEPIIISEWGGWSMNVDNLNNESNREKGWGYHGLMFKDFNGVLDLYEQIIRILVDRKAWISGHCYTEFCDQYQEMNGMLTFDRRPKGDIARLKRINGLL